MSTHSSKPAGGGGIPIMHYNSRHLPVDPQASFSGKTILVIGATSGIGYEAAIKFAKLGADRIIIGARNLKTGKACQEHFRSLGSSHLQVDLFKIDMASTASIRDFFVELSAEVEYIDVAIVNAGLAVSHFESTSEGWERSIQIEVLGKALCSIQLLPILRRTAKHTGEPAILQITGSEGYLDIVDSDLQIPSGLNIIDHYNDPANFALVRQYCLCKLLMMFVQRGLVESLKDDPYSPAIIVTSPGMTSTGLGREFHWIFRFIMWIVHSLVARTAEAGSRTLVSAALLKKEEANGTFWMNDTYNERRPKVSDEVWEERWEGEYRRILEILDRAVPGTSNLVKSR